LRCVLLELNPMTKTLSYGLHTITFTPQGKGIRVHSECRGQWPHTSVVLMDRQRALMRWATLRKQGFVQV
jgi:hypothetical protein